jgi:hypothetical protein
MMSWAMMSSILNRSVGSPSTYTSSTSDRGMANRSSSSRAAAWSFRLPTDRQQPAVPVRVDPKGGPPGLVDVHDQPNRPRCAGRDLGCRAGACLGAA